MNLSISPDTTKKEAFKIVENYMNQLGLPIATKDETRPWGGFFCIADEATQKFIDTFFHDVPVSSVKKSEKLSPKILLVEKHKRLSWQYHHRRSEIWRVIAGNVLVVISDNDNQTMKTEKMR